MGGGLVQLISTGEQDNYITFQPEITFFKTVYLRHSNFSIETKESMFQNVSFGQKSVCKISRDGDLISNMSIHIELGSLNSNKKNNNDSNVCIKDLELECCCDKCNKINSDTIFGWINGIGHAIIESVDIDIGGYTIDKQYGEWLDIWTELAQTSEKRAGYYEMVGKKDFSAFKVTTFRDNMTLIVPLNFWFCRNIGLSIPLISLTNHDVTVSVKWRDFNQLWISNKSYEKPNIPSFNAHLMIDYIYLDLYERKKFASENHIYLIDQVQFSGDYYFDKANYNPIINLDFYHPCKEIVWVVQRTDVLIRSKDNDPDFSYGNDWFNYTNSKSKMRSGIDDTFESAVLQFNGMNRFQPLNSKYFRLLQPYYYHTRIPTNYIYNYCFSLKPEEHQPTGTCNFSQIKDKRLVINMKNKRKKSDYIVKIYAVNYNLLIITGGMAGIGFSF